ncbi:uncharacterized protein LOC114192159 [Vigna unguiculata]|uniref:uncharacterized protein LOC114192159 n=1 Tax=Vigna unguiculata TaxID=3917 RepID=UPI0010163627|nr:uncharacterized protein LOC114192159 [Vigna unguiculata]
MREKYIALLLLLCHVVAASVQAETFEEKRRGCYNYCIQACIYPQTFCKWWCNGRCKNPTLCDSLAKDNGSNSTEYPVPTEENYQNYLSTPPPSPPSNKNEVHPKLIAVDEPNNDL